MLSAAARLVGTVDDMFEAFQLSLQLPTTAVSVLVVAAVVAAVVKLGAKHLTRREADPANLVGCTARISSDDVTSSGGTATVTNTDGVVSDIRVQRAATPEAVAAGMHAGAVVQIVSFDNSTGMFVVEPVSSAHTA